VLQRQPGHKIAQTSWQSLWKSHHTVLAGSLLIAVTAVLLYSCFKPPHQEAEPSERPYVVSESAAWQNGTAEAIVSFKNRGKSNAIQNETQIHFMTTIEAPDSLRLDWGQLSLASSIADLASNAAYSTSASTHLTPEQSNDLLHGLAVAYVYGITEYHDVFGRSWTQKYCWKFDALSNPGFVTCPSRLLE
jgi:hypothetical protein